MRSTRFALFPLAALAACATKEARRPDTTSPATATLAGAPAPDAATVRRAIEASDSSFSAAALRGDSTGLASHYADDAVLMLANVPAARGHEAIARSFGALVSTMKLSAFKLQTQDVTLAGEYAIETGAYQMTSQMKGAKPIQDIGKYIVVWKKQPDGSYKIFRDIANSDLAAK
jgi:ketosteroid isomerase-like protein